MEKRFKVTRFPQSSSVCDDISLIATRCNGLPNNEKLTIDDFISYAKFSKLHWKNTNAGMTIEKISDTHLIIDVDCEPALEIIEILEVDFPTLDAYNHNSN